MRNILLKLLSVAAALVAVSASPAAAQATRTWVSGVGDDVNPCSRTAPCKTFAGAISKTAAGGEINALDSGGFGAVTITKAITIKADGVTGGVLTSAGTSGITINALSTDRVVLDGLDLEGVGTALNGISILSARDVVIRNTSIRNFNAAGGNCVKINTTTSIRVTLDDSFLINCQTGVAVLNTNGTGKARIYNTMIHVTAIAGITVTVAGNTADISNTEILATPKSLNITAGGVVRSYGNNVLDGTITDAPTPTALQ